MGVSSTTYSATPACGGRSAKVMVAATAGGQRALSAREFLRPAAHDPRHAAGAWRPQPRGAGKALAEADASGHFDVEHRGIGRLRGDRGHADGIDERASAAQRGGGAGGIGTSAFAVADDEDARRAMRRQQRARSVEPGGEIAGVVADDGVGDAVIADRARRLRHRGALAARHDR